MSISRRALYFPLGVAIFLFGFLVLRLGIWMSISMTCPNSGGCAVSGFVENLVPTSIPLILTGLGTMIGSALFNARQERLRRSRIIPPYHKTR